MKGIKDFTKQFNDIGANSGICGKCLEFDDLRTHSIRCKGFKKCNSFEERFKNNEPKESQNK